MQQKVDDRLIGRQRERGGWAVDLAAGFWRDLRFAVRSIGRLRLFSIPVILTLAVAIGGTTAVFSFVNGILLKPLGFESPEELVELRLSPADSAAAQAYAAANERDRWYERYHLTYPHFEEWRLSTTDILEGLAVYDHFWQVTVGFSDGARRLGGAWVSANLFSLLRVAPEVGRGFTAEEDVRGAPPVVILSHRVWQTRFDGRREVIGQTLRVDGEPHTIVGVMPAGFGFPSPGTDLWRPMSGAWRGTGQQNYSVLGRLKRGVTLREANTRIRSRFHTRVREGPEAGSEIEERWSGGLLTLRDFIVGDVRNLMLTFFAAIAGVLLIACVTVVNLMLSQAIGREREYLVRAALGAGRMRLMRQMLTESTLLSLVGGVAGLGVAAVLVELMLRFGPHSLPRSEGVGLDVNVLLFTFALVLVLGLGIGLVPAIRASAADLVSGLKSGASGSSRGIRRNRMSHGLVVAQLGMSLMLLISAGLLLRSFSGMLARERGFDPSRVLGFDTSLPASRYRTFEERRQFYNQLLEDMRTLPGVDAAAVALYLPATDWFHSAEFEPPHYQKAPDEELIAESKPVSSGYFRTLGIRLIQGRLFDDRRDPAADPPVIINREMARRYWPDHDAVGSTLILNPGMESPETVTVVGVVDDVMLRAGGRARGDEENLQIYRSYAASEGTGDLAILVRTASDPRGLFPQIQRRVAATDPEVVLYGAAAIQDLLSERVTEPRYRAVLMGVFGLVALILAIVGVYGVMAFSVSQRMREMGIRMALGARRERIVKEVLARGLVLALIGLGLGLAGAWTATTLLRGYLYGIGAHDPVTIGFSVLVLAVSALMACVLPALRAGRVDPVIALRSE